MNWYPAIFLLLLVGCQPKAAFNNLDGAFSHFRQEKKVSFQNTQMKFGEPLSRELLMDVLQFDESELPGVGEEVYPKGAFITTDSIRYFLYNIGDSINTKALRIRSFEDTFFLNDVELISWERNPGIHFGYDIVLSKAAITLLAENGNGFRRKKWFILRKGELIRLDKPIVPDLVFLEKIVHIPDTPIQFYNDYASKKIRTKNGEMHEIEGIATEWFGGKIQGTYRLFKLTKNSYSHHPFACIHTSQVQTDNSLKLGKFDLFLLASDSFVVQNTDMGETKLPTEEKLHLPYPVTMEF